MENNFQKTEWLWGCGLTPLTQSQLDNIPSTSKAAAVAASASASSSKNGSESCQLSENLLQFSSCVIIEEPGFSGWSKPKGSASKRPVDPDYNTRARVKAAPRAMLTRGQLKKDQAMLLDETSAENGPKDQKPKPQIVTLRRFRTAQRLMPTTWHSGNACHHAMSQMCSPETRPAVGNDVERWRAIESICLDLRGINVSRKVGVLNGPVSFEDVFEVLGLDEQGEPQVDPVSLPEIKVDLPGRNTEVASTSRSFGIEKSMMPPLVPIQKRPGRGASGRVSKREPKSVTKRSKPVEKRTTKSVNKKR